MIRPIRVRRGIFGSLEHRTIHLVEMQYLAPPQLGVGNHRAELVRLEGPTVKAAPQLPEDDRHIIVTIHYYAPLTFTHQGAPWVMNGALPTGVTWGSPAEYQAITDHFDLVARWSKAHQRPIFLGEFGAYDKGAMTSRAAYTAAVARAAEAHGWPWAYWQFDSDFIAYDMKRQSWVEPILKALVP